LAVLSWPRLPRRGSFFAAPSRGAPVLPPGFDAPADPAQVERAIDHLRSDAILLYASDFPHWQFEGDETVPAAIPQSLRRKIMVDNPLATYSRLKEHAQ
jgi:predicted TIM-barrel fold metal-dependent hydrolase